MIERLKKERIIAILRGLEPENYTPVTRALFDGGIRMMEVTFDQRKPDTFFQTAQAIYKMKVQFGEDVLAGAGTVLDCRQAELAKSAGASYVVTPNVNREVITRAKELGMGCLPGAMTPTEVEAAYLAGADMVKVFPASVLGPEYFRALSGPLGHIPLAAVGGVDLNNMKDFFRAGAMAAGIGSQLTDKKLILKGDWESLKGLAETYTAYSREK